jgi:polyisoprenoid-binding protein YceI
VSFPTGTYRLGPEDGTLSVHTGRKGAAAKAGHDLRIHVTAWQATLRLAEDPAATTLELEADATSLRVQEGTGGMQSLGDDDKANIHSTIDDDVLKGQAIAFRSTQVTAADGRLGVQGELTLGDTTRPLAFDLAIDDDGKVTGAAVVKQTEWGMKPYSTLFGALKVADEVRVEIDAALPQSA